MHSHISAFASVHNTLNNQTEFCLVKSLKVNCQYDPIDLHLKGTGNLFLRWGKPLTRKLSIKEAINSF